MLIVRLIREITMKEPSSKETFRGAEHSGEEVNTVLDSIERSASIAIPGREETIYCLSVVGQIEGHYTLSDGQKATKYEQIIPLLVSVEENSEFDGLLVILNTMGGDVEAGLAIAEMVASMAKPSVSLVLGGALVVILCKLLDRTEHSGKGKAAIAIGLLALIAAVLAYMYLAPVTERNMPEVDLHGKESLWKLLGAAAGLVLAWFVDERWTHFDTEAPLWGQLVKLLGGVVIVVAVKSGLKPVLVALMGDVPLAHALRYFLMAAAGAALWPMTFCFYAGKQ